MSDQPIVADACTDVPSEDQPEPVLDPLAAKGRRMEQAINLLDAAIAVAYHAGLPSLTIANRINRTRAKVFASVAEQCPGQNLQCPEVETELAKGYSQAVTKVFELCADEVINSSETEEW